MDYREIYKGRGIKVYHDATLGGGYWLFDIYDQRDSNLVYGGGSADTEPSALAAARNGSTIGLPDQPFRAIARPRILATSACPRARAPYSAAGGKDAAGNRVIGSSEGERPFLAYTPRGFTLLELMIVVAIIGILAAIAYPAYLDYSKRARMSELMLAVSACRTPVAEVYQSIPTAPGAGNWGCEVTGPASAYVQSIATNQDGKIIVMARGFNDATIDGKIVTLVPLIDGAPATSAMDMGKPITAWRCGDVGDGTTIPPQYLPASCRGT